MTNKQANSIGTATMLLVAIIIIYAVSCSSCKIIDCSTELTDLMINTTIDCINNKDTIEHIKDDTEHIWIGGDGDTIIE